MEPKSGVLSRRRAVGCCDINPAHSSKVELPQIIEEIVGCSKKSQKAHCEKSISPAQGVLSEIYSP
jgi:hypothetical protein